MDTAPLKSFATSARTELIREVTARITAVLAPGSPEHIEQPSAVAALEKAIAAAERAGDRKAGSGKASGAAHIADRVAYTWFNRIIALRFMDANRYTGIGVVSPAADQIGQPEVLAAAKRGQIDPLVVTNAAERDRIAGLLSGSRAARPGTDPQAEAYALLLAAYCRHWHKAMPFMFEAEGDFTELLIPSNLLADDSALSRSVEVLTETACQDVEVIGWLYQFYISERKDEVFAGFKKNKKAGADEIPAATQLFTPHWIVRYLVENSLGRLWMLNHPESKLIDQMQYYIAPVDEETDFLKIGKPEELTVMDPACGSGHMLTYAFDLLYAIYEEQGYAPSEIPSLILTHNLFGAEIDGRAGSLAAFALTMKAAARRKLFLKNPVEPNICVLDPIRFSPDELDYLVTRDGDREAEQAFWNQFEHADTFGSLIQADLALTERLSAHLETLDGGGDLYKADPIMWARQVIRQAEILLPGYAVVVANPPYMGSANMEALTTEWVASQYPAEKQDLYACFVRRALQLGTKSGVVALITGDSWMALKTFAQFRNELLTGLTFANFIHLDDVSKHADIFGANTAYVCTLSAPNNATCLCVELEPLSSEAKDELLRDAINRQDAPWTYQVQPSLFRSIPGSPFAYRLSLTDIAAFETGVSLSDIVSFHEGINTGDNDRFLRRWWEVSFDRVSLVTSPGERPRTTWVPHKKGGSYRKWAGNQEYVLNWSNDGEEIRSFARSTTRNTQYFFRASLSWGRISSGDFSIRSYPTGYSFDSTGPCVFGAEGALAFTLGYLNSDLAKHFLRTLSSSLDYRLGNLGNMPAPADYSQFVDSHIERLIDLAQRDWDASELSWGFASDSLVDQQDFRVSDSFASVIASRERLVSEVARLEEDNERRVRSLFSFPATGVARDNSRVALRANPEFQFAPGAQFTDLRVRDAAISDLISYAVGCMFGRYSLDEPGLILADQASTVQDYFAKVPEPTFAPDEDNVIPIVDGDWFDDDIVARFREFLRVAFGEEHFEENLRFVEESLGVKTVRDYFITGKGKSKFYDDHVKRFKKRPIYWLFSSPKGSFNALIYLHRYTPATVGAVLTYLREYITKIDSAREQAERAANAKEADRLRTVLLELRDYERTVYELASEQIAIDLDDGVRVNYPKFYPALKKIPGLEAAE